MVNKGHKIKENMDIVYGYFPKLALLSKKVAGYLSGGEQQMMVMGRAMMAQPKLILLDEPSLGLAPMLQREILGIMEKMNRQEKVSVLIVEQNVKAALDIAGYGYVMENGRVVLDDSAERLRDNEDIKEFYLGLSSLGNKRMSFREVKHYKRRKRWLV